MDNAAVEWKPGQQAEVQIVRGGIGTTEWVPAEILNVCKMGKPPVITSCNVIATGPNWTKTAWVKVKYLRIPQTAKGAS